MDGWVRDCGGNVGKVLAKMLELYFTVMTMFPFLRPVSI